MSSNKLLIQATFLLVLVIGTYAEAIHFDSRNEEKSHLFLNHYQMDINNAKILKSQVEFDEPFYAYNLEQRKFSPYGLTTENQNAFSSETNKYLQHKLNSIVSKHDKYSKKTLIYHPKLLKEFYRYERYQPVWISEKGPNQLAKDLIVIIRNADIEGFESSTYHLEAISSLLTEINLSMVTDSLHPEKCAQFDILLTDALFSYGIHLSGGVIKPDPENFEWHIKKPQKSIAKLLYTLVKDGNPEHFINHLRPSHSGYKSLKQALMIYQKIENTMGWGEIPPGPELKKGSIGKRVKMLRLRLLKSGDMSYSSSKNPESFDEGLAKGIRNFQIRHGLDVDGIVGSATLMALNIPVEDRIQQIKLNMERWRWIPDNLGERYILVNTADFKLDVIENGKRIHSIRAIVGKDDRPTPVFSGKITYMELNPYWNIPHNIAIKDILPKVKNDPEYLNKKNIRIFENWSNDAKEISSDSIDWSPITENNFSFKLRQDPKTTNALGRIKFMFPNPFSIYLHDTPSQYLFNMTKRNFSSGCIRIEKPIDLADYLLQGIKGWDREKLVSAVDSNKTKAILIPNPINIHILYWTAWAEQDGTIHFRDDIYGRDMQLNTALRRENHTMPVTYGENIEKGEFLSSEALPVSKPAHINMNEF